MLEVLSYLMHSSIATEMSISYVPRQFILNVTPLGWTFTVDILLIEFPLPCCRAYLLQTSLFPASIEGWFAKRIDRGFVRSSSFDRYWITMVSISVSLYINKEILRQCIFRFDRVLLITRIFVYGFVVVVAVENL